MIKNIAVFTIVFLLLVTAGLGTALYINSIQKANLKEQMSAIQTQYDAIKNHMDNQNKSIEDANRQLVKYKTEIEMIQKEADKRNKQLAQELKKIATCEDGWKVLQKELENLKELE